MNDRITLRRRGAGEDVAGNPSNAWADAFAVWAEVRYPSGLEATKADARVSLVKASIKVRRRADITADMRVVVPGGQIFDIKAVLPANSRDFMFLACESCA